MVKWLSNRAPKLFNEEKIAFSTNYVVKTGYPEQKNQVGSLPYTIHKNEFNMDQTPKHKRETIKLYEKNTSDTEPGKWLLGYDTKCTGKRKNR